MTSSFSEIHLAPSSLLALLNVSPNAAVSASHAGSPIPASGSPAGRVTTEEGEQRIEECAATTATTQVPRQFVFSATEMCQILAHARTPSNYHTRTAVTHQANSPIAAKKSSASAASGSGFSSSSSVPSSSTPRSITGFHSTYLNHFLRLYMCKTTTVPLSTLQDALQFCVNNDPVLVHKCQLLAQNAFVGELDRRSHKHILPTSSSSSGGASSSSHKHRAADEPFLLEQLRRNLPPYSGNAPPKFSCTQLHHRFLVDPMECESNRDMFFSAQVRIRNEGKIPFSIIISQRYTQVIDGGDGDNDEPRATATVSSFASATSTTTTTTTTSDDQNYDFQVLFDKQNLAKHESSVIVLSLIAKPTAVFSSIHESIVLSIDETLKVLVSFVVINPAGPLFGRGFPGCLSAPVFGSPMGHHFESPLALQLFENAFRLRNGYRDKNVLHVLDSAFLADANVSSVVRTVSAKAILDEECDVVSLLCGREVGAADSPSHTPKPPLMFKLALPINLQSPAFRRAIATAVAAVNTEEGGGSPTSSDTDQQQQVQHSSSKANASIVGGVQTVNCCLPGILQSENNVCCADILLLILNWLCDFPTHLFIDHAVIACGDPFSFVEQLQPCYQGVILWVVDFCCRMTQQHSGNGIGIRVLAVAFASALMHSVKEKRLRKGNKQEKEEEEVEGEGESEKNGAAAAAKRKASRESLGVTMAELVNLEQHLATMLVALSTYHFYEYFA